MSAVKINIDTDYLVKLYTAGTSKKEIASIIGVSEQTVARNLAKAGFAMNGAKIFIRNKDEIISLFKVGFSVFYLSARFGISRSAINKVLTDAGVDTRNMSSASAERYKRTSAQDRTNMTTAAHNAVRGKIYSFEQKADRATAYTKRIVGLYEREVIEHLMMHGLFAISQKPVGPYNIDITIDTPLVAVEIYSAHPGKSRMAYLRDRAKYILNSHSLLIVQVNYPRRFIDIPSVCDKIIRFCDFVSRNETPVGHYTVIRGNGNIATTSSHNLDNRTIVSAF